MQTQKLTPLMRQYWQIKSLHKDKILLFRMGDFFEMFYEDAEKAAPILNITLTARNKKSSDKTKMCGVPHHSIAGPIGKLLAAGFKVAICDQIEPVSQAKGLVKRAVTRILTPGMVYDPEGLDQLRAHYLCAFDDSSVSFTDTSTGEAFFYMTEDEQRRWHIIRLLNPVELVLTAEQKKKMFPKKEWKEFHFSVFEEKSSEEINQNELEEPTDQRNRSNKTNNLPLSAYRLKSYIAAQKRNIKINQTFQQKKIGKEIWFSSQAQEHLEIFKTYDGDTKDSLFSAVNRTKTPSGARLLKARLRSPSTDRKEIETRLDSVEKWLPQPEKIQKIRDLLSQVGDIERKLGKIFHPQCNGRDLLSLAESLQMGLQLIPFDQTLCSSVVVLDSVHKLVEEIIRSIRPDAPVGIQEGNMIKKGVAEELDQLIEETEKRQSALRRLEEQERVQTGIPSLKIRYNNVFGYYIEVTKVHSKKVPSYYIRKQTLTQAERYTMEKLQLIEEKILSSRTQRIEMELFIFENLRQKVMGALPDLFYLSRVICEMDVSVALAYLAIEQSYTRPTLTAGKALVLVNHRHPVVEQKQKQHFVPNTIRMKEGECLLLTGPNMAGKSTLMRQVALSVILSQAGSFVPAEQAMLPVFTKLFTRIGASDSLSQGLSTFMVEMKESVEILKQADEHSLVILDEIGRGTATYDGMSLAQAILEYLVQKKRSLIFFATHYHELTDLTKSFPRIRNAHLSVSEKDGHIEFLYTLSSGALAQSYGIHVARLAGFPLDVIKRAEELLKKREAGTFIYPHQQQMDLFSAPPKSSSFKDSFNSASLARTQNKKEDKHLKELIREIKSYPLQEKSPLETMNAVAGWKKEITKRKPN
ncbi:MAG: DNA mismatch repair protein MutS [Bdellovibrionales bacterium]|nr:DNA mismatch repair protein MutS [Bdellovibrionales bacterium]